MNPQSPAVQKDETRKLSPSIESQRSIVRGSMIDRLRIPIRFVCDSVRLLELQRRESIRHYASFGLASWKGFQ